MKKMNAPSIEKDWEVRDRIYKLKKITPLTYKVKSRRILWFDEEAGINREIRYAVNQNSLFVDEQDKHVRLGHVVFVDGDLFVPKSQQTLQKLLSLYHPDRHKWVEIDKVKEAVDDVANIEMEIEAMKLAMELDIEHLEAMLRTEVGSAVTRMSSKEIKRDIYIMAKKDPQFFVDLAKDEDIKLRNLANRAVEAGILKLTDDNTVFKFAANGKKVMTVPFDQHPYVALAQYFKTDDGVTLMKSITKKLG